MKPNYGTISDLAKHCDKAKLKVAETQAFEYDLKDALCDVWSDIDFEDEDPDNKVAIIWGLFSYARYVENSTYIDTASGLVRKDHSNSFPIPLSEVQGIARQYRDMAKIEIERYLISKCKESNSDCFCGGGCKRMNNTRLFPYRGKNLKKFDTDFR